MQFSTALLAALTVGTQVLAAPAVFTRNVTVGSVAENIYTAVSTLEQAVAADVQDLRYLVESATSDVTVGAEVEVKLVSIASSLVTAAESIESATAGAVGTVVTSEVALVIIALDTVDAVVNGLVSVIADITTNLVADALTLVVTEVNTIATLIEPVVQPIDTFASSTITLVGNNTLTTKLQSVTYTALSNTQAGINSISTVV